MKECYSEKRKRFLVFLYVGFILDHFFTKKVLNIFEKRSWLYGICTKLTFPPQQKNWHNRTTVLYTKYVCNTKIYFPPEPKKLTQHHNCMVLQVHSSMYNQNIFPARTKNWHNSTNGKKVPPAHAKHGQVPPAHAKRVSLSVSPSVCLSVRAKRGME